MRQYLALLRLQLLSRYADLKPKNFKNLDAKQRKQSLGRMALYAFLVLYLGGVLVYVETKAIGLLMKMGQPPRGLADLLVIAAVGISMIGTLVLSFFSVMSTLYLGRDSAFLAALPFKPRTILAAKMTQIWISEVLINAVILLPACAIFGLHTGEGWLFYLRTLLVWPLTPVLPICIGAVLATLLVRATVRIRHKETLLTVGGLALMVLYFYFAMMMGGITGDSESGGEMLMQLITSNAARVQGFTKSFPPAGWAAFGVMGSWSQLGLLALVSLAAAALLIWGLGFFYRKLSLIQAEAPTDTGRKGIQKGAYSRTGTAMSALMKREIRQILRVPSYATNILPVCLLPALMIVLMGVFIGRNMGDAGEGITELLAQLPGSLLIAVLSAFLCFMADMNPALSTAVTREGRGHDFMLGLPVSVETHILSKLYVGYGLTALGLALTIVALLILIPTAWLEILLTGVLCLMFTYICSCLSLARDVKKPKLNWVTEQEAVKQNFGVLISMVVSLAFLAVLGGISWLLIAEARFDTWPYFGVMAALLLAGCAAARVYLMKTGKKYYFVH